VYRRSTIESSSTHSANRLNDLHGAVMLQLSLRSPCQSHRSCLSVCPCWPTSRHVRLTDCRSSPCFLVGPRSAVQYCLDSREFSCRSASASRTDFIGCANIPMWCLAARSRTHPLVETHQRISVEQTPNGTQAGSFSWLSNLTMHWPQCGTPLATA